MELLATVKALTGARRARRGRRIQSLWRGYGEVVLVHLEGGPAATVVAKHVRPPAGAHPRKLRSYAVETHWYRTVAPTLPGLPRCPAFLGATTAGEERIIVLEDLLGAGFTAPLPRGPGPARTAALDWLARLHAAALEAPTAGLWPVGTYWHLQTRQAELAATPDPRWRAEAPALDAALRGARFQTLVHGDAKPANFLWSERTGACAAVDFQYLGGGPGVRDVVYLLDVHEPDDPALDPYFRALQEALPPGVDGAALEQEWRGLVPVAARDFQRFLAGWGRG